MKDRPKPPGRWVSEYRFEFDPPITLQPGSSTPQTIRAFDLTAIANMPDIAQQREQMLDDFFWNTLLTLSPPSEGDQRP